MKKVLIPIFVLTFWPVALQGQELNCINNSGFSICSDKYLENVEYDEQHDAFRDVESQHLIKVEKVSLVDRNAHIASCYTQSNLDNEFFDTRDCTHLASLHYPGVKNAFEQNKDYNDSLDLSLYTKDFDDTIEVRFPIVITDNQSFIQDDRGWPHWSEFSQYFDDYRISISRLNEELDEAHKALMHYSISKSDETNIFQDVDLMHINFEAISALKEAGIVSGNPDGTYRPDDPITRAAFTKIVAGAAHNQEFSGSNCFPDVLNEWFAPFVCFAKSIGMIGGYSTGLFMPANNINFAEAAKIVVNAFSLELPDDDSDVWYEAFISALEDINAVPDSIRSPEHLVTRGEMAEIIYAVMTSEQ